MRFNEALEEFEVAGRLAYVRYQFDGQLIPEGGGEPVGSHSKRVLIFRLSDDGIWKIVHNIWNSPTALPSRD